MQDLTQRIEKIMLEIKHELKVDYEWESSEILRFKRRGAKGYIKISQNNFKLTLNLGMMLRALRTPIERKIIKAVDEYLN